jgi:hypothetical protein
VLLLVLLLVLLALALLVPVPRGLQELLLEARQLLLPPLLQPLLDPSRSLSVAVSAQAGPMTAPAPLPRPPWAVLPRQPLMGLVCTVKRTQSVLAEGTCTKTVVLAPVPARCLT